MKPLKDKIIERAREKAFDCDCMDNYPLNYADKGAVFIKDLTQILDEVMAEGDFYQRPGSKEWIVSVVKRSIESFCELYRQGSYTTIKEALENVKISAAEEHQLGPTIEIELPPFTETLAKSPQPIRGEEELNTAAYEWASKHEIKNPVRSMMLAFKAGANHTPSPSGSEKPDARTRGAEDLAYCLFKLAVPDHDFDELYNILKPQLSEEGLNSLRKLGEVWNIKF